MLNRKTAKRKVHYYPWDGCTESDSDMPDFVYCGQSGPLEQYQLGLHRNQVTCKRCLKALEKEKKS